MFANGTLAEITVAFPLASVDSTWPLLLLRSPITSPIKSSGVTTSTFIIGSKSFNWAF